MSSTSDSRNTPPPRVFTIYGFSIPRQRTSRYTSMDNIRLHLKQGQLESIPLGFTGPADFELPCLKIWDMNLSAEFVHQHRWQSLDEASDCQLIELLCKLVYHTRRDKQSCFFHLGLYEVIGILGPQECFPKYFNLGNQSYKLTPHSRLMAEADVNAAPPGMISRLRYSSTLERISKQARQRKIKHAP